jgi:hypothetical protein
MENNPSADYANYTDQEITTQEKTTREKATNELFALVFYLRNLRNLRIGFSTLNKKCQGR